MTLDRNPFFLHYDQWTWNCFKVPSHRRVSREFIIRINTLFLQSLSSQYLPSKTPLRNTIVRRVRKPRSRVTCLPRTWKEFIFGIHCYNVRVSFHMYTCTGVRLCEPSTPLPWVSFHLLSLIVYKEELLQTIYWLVVFLDRLTQPRWKREFSRIYTFYS